MNCNLCYNLGGGFPLKKNQSAEDYLEQILVLSKVQKQVKSIDVVRALGFSKPSVSIAMKKLETSNLITIDHGNISLTEEGLLVASTTLEKHTILTDFFKSLGVNEKTALDDACKIEHLISDESFIALKTHINKNKK